MRSAGHADAHDGVLNNGTVITRCGLTFRPQQEMFGGGPAVLHPPVDEHRCCPGCWNAGNREEETERAAVAGLIEALGRYRR